MKKHFQKYFSIFFILIIFSSNLNAQILEKDVKLDINKTTSGITYCLNKDTVIQSDIMQIQSFMEKNEIPDEYTIFKWAKNKSWNKIDGFIDSIKSVNNSSPVLPFFKVYSAYLVLGYGNLNYNTMSSSQKDKVLSYLNDLIDWKSEAYPIYYLTLMNLKKHLDKETFNGYKNRIKNIPSNLLSQSQPDLKNAKIAGTKTTLGDIISSKGKTYNVSIFKKYKTALQKL